MRGGASKLYTRHTHCLNGRDFGYFPYSVRLNALKMNIDEDDSAHSHPLNSYEYTEKFL